MERVLNVYRRPYDPARPVVCKDKTPRQAIREVQVPIPASPGQRERHDYEYQRCGVCNVFMASEPLTGRRITKVTERKTEVDWAHFPLRHRCGLPEREPHHPGDGQPEHPQPWRAG
jgi:hypothetical protein